jgi:hypothetical protein
MCEDVARDSSLTSRNRGRHSTPLQTINRIRYNQRRLTRRTNGFSKDLTWFEKQLWVSLAYDHLVLPHTRLQEPLPTPEPTRGLGSQRKWRPVTPAMAAGLTDHVWTTQELLSYRVSAAFLDQLHTIEHLFPRWDEFHHGS